jgi:hypothetical protein
MTEVTSSLNVTSWKTAHLEKLKVTQLTKKFLVFNRIGIFINSYTEERH